MYNYPNPASLVTKEKIEKRLKSLTGLPETNAIKRKFASLFEKTDYSVYSRIGDYNNEVDELLDGNQEYLYDLAVFTEDRRNEADRKQPMVHDTILVLESELNCNFNHIMFDFHKLLIANSHFKVMLFRCHSSETEDYLSYMKSNISSYTSSNGIFFIACYLNDKNSWTVRDFPGNRQG